MAESREKTCASRLAVLEDEAFFAVGDRPLGLLLNEHFADDRRHGLMAPMPDLLSVKKEGDRHVYRIREVKFRLERRLVEKAMRQLRSGLEALRRRFEAPVVDRVELVVALEGRALKPGEREFLGTPLGHDRYVLLLDGRPEVLAGATVSVLLL